MKAIIRIRPVISRSLRFFSSSSSITEADRQRIRQFYTRGYQQRAKKAYDLKQEILNADTALSTQLSPAQKKMCQMLVDKIFSLSPTHLQHFYLTLSSQREQPLLAQHIDWNNLPRKKDGKFENVVPQYFIQQEIMSQVEPTVDLAQILGLSKVVEQKAEETQTEEKEEKKEVAREKDNYDIELLGYDDKMKIKLIKEIRAMKKLGLKEAKEEIEGLPKWIYRGVKADEAKEIAKKLTELGAEIKMI